MPTIGDVARAAGVSRSTVSYALSGKRTISAETRRRIDEAIAALNFTPNAGARALRTAQTMVLGLLLQFHEDEFAPAMLQYVLPITDAARAMGYDILMMTEADGAAALARVSRSAMVDGLILLDVTHDGPRLDALRAAHQPGVLVGLPGDTDGLDVFDLDFADAARTLVDHLHALGHRELVYLAGPDGYSNDNRTAGLRSACDRLGLAPVLLGPFPAVYGESRQPAIDQSVHALLDRMTSTTALMVHNDATIAALPSLLHRRGIEVPGDLSVVSLYSKDFARSFSLPYTAVESSPDKLGRLAVEQLGRRIRIPDTAGEPVVRFIAAELVDRGSTR